MIVHNFAAGQKVVCVSDHFPVIRKYGGTGEEANLTPKEGEVLIIDEILGEFLRFDKYDTDESFNWWMADRFAPLNEDVETLVSFFHIIGTDERKTIDI